jgi:3-hydroxyacyl-CoA dehydrogenase/enoyl-CoA hydratase/3-hydroxybutyryl-CoA epimerase
MNSQAFNNFHVETDRRGITTISLDVPDRPLNVLTYEVMEELESIVHNLETDPDCKLAVFRSDKESGFLAGADVSKIAKIESTTHAMQVIERGQNLFQRIEWLPIPTVAIIHGPCLGGGLELALACDHRIARDNSSTQLGLPEIKLGLIPGWGGTQRLPRVAGLRDALEMILTGKSLNASEALRIGLIDLAIRPENWDRGVDAFLEKVLQGRVNGGPRRRRAWRRALEATRFGRNMIFRITGRSIASKTEHYPALAAALRAVRHGFQPTPEGYLCERNEFVDLLATPTCRNLLSLFFARERARNQSNWSSAKLTEATPPIRTVGVVGAGAMGAGVGQLAALRGFKVIMKEINTEAAEAGRQRIGKLITDYARRKGINAESRAKIEGKISFSCEDLDLADCDLVIEAVVEREDVKANVFRSLDRVLRPDAILCSNTSSLSIGRMAEATERPSQVAGLHFFNPVHRMELVEVVRARGTDEATIARLVSFVRALGKTPIVTADSPGFLVNRVLFPYLGEAILMVGEGIEPTNIDRQVRRFGMPMGPLELLDQVGLDVAYHVAKSLDGVLPGVAPVVNSLTSFVDAGQLGKKSGRGFYVYQKGKRRAEAELPMLRLRDSRSVQQPDFADDSLTAIQRRLIYPMLAEAVRCHQEGVVSNAWAIDLGMVLGTGFAPHRGGPLHVIDSLGIERVTANMERLQSELGSRFTPPQQLIEMCRDGDRFFAKEQPSEQLAASFHGST